MVRKQNTNCVVMTETCNFFYNPKFFFFSFFGDFLSKFQLSRHENIPDDCLNRFKKLWVSESLETLENNTENLQLIQKKAASLLAYFDVFFRKETSEFSS